MAVYLGINPSRSVSSVAVLRTEDGAVVESAVYLQERLLKKKHAGGFPLLALRSLKQDRPDLWGQLEANRVAFTTFGQHPISQEKSYLERKPALHDWMSSQGLELSSAILNPQASHIGHHDAHAYSVWLSCPFETALVVVMDGGGSFASQTGEPNSMEWLSVYRLDSDGVHLLQQEWMKLSFTGVAGLNLSTGLGTLFEAAATWIFGSPFEAGKVMGLAPFGRAQKISDQLQFIESLRAEMPDFPRGKVGFDAMGPELFQRAADVAASVQKHFEVRVADLLGQYRERWPDLEHLVFVGGCALNCSFNGKLKRSKLFDGIYIPPFPNDEGVALGAATQLAIKQEKLRYRTEALNSVSLGPWGGDVSKRFADFDRVMAGFHLTRPQELAREVAELLVKGRVVAWVQGRSEVGPRALGQRSLLARPDGENVKSYLNGHVKHREGFRPYGAITLKEWVREFLDTHDPDGYEFMNFALPVRPEWRDRLGAVTHVDGTCRIQTLTENAQGLRLVLEEFRRKSGIPALLNTSLNVMGQPILETLEDARAFLLATPVSYLVYGDWLVTASHPSETAL